MDAPSEASREDGSPLVVRIAGGPRPGSWAVYDGATGRKLTNVLAAAVAWEGPTAVVSLRLANGAVVDAAFDEETPIAVEPRATVLRFPAQPPDGQEG